MDIQMATFGKGLVEAQDRASPEHEMGVKTQIYPQYDLGEGRRKGGWKWPVGEAGLANSCSFGPRPTERPARRDGAKFCLDAP